MTSLARFARMWAGLGCAAGAPAQHEALRTAWSEPQRVYHDTSHLADCLALLDEVRELADRPDEVECALWFHDAVYDPRAMDNEAKSAAWAARALREGGAPDEVGVRVAAHVLATAAHDADASGDAALVLDVDLSILGADPERFDAYDAAIRREYAWVPDEPYGEGRARILRSLDDRDPLYLTPQLRKRFEAQAHENLRRALAGLSAH